MQLAARYPTAVNKSETASKRRILRAVDLRRSFHIKKGVMIARLPRRDKTLETIVAGFVRCTSVKILVWLMQVSAETLLPSTEANAPSTNGNRDIRFRKGYSALGSAFLLLGGVANKHNV